jgi:ankyrin repeat protein
VGYAILQLKVETSRGTVMSRIIEPNVRRRIEDKEFTPLQVYIMEGGTECQEANVGRADSYFSYEHAWRKYKFSEKIDELTPNQDCTGRSLSCYSSEYYTPKFFIEHGSLMKTLTFNCILPAQKVTYGHRIVKSGVDNQPQKIEHTYTDYDYKGTISEKYGDCVNMGNKDGLTPLHVAATMGDERFIKALLENGAGVNAVDNENNTPLHISIYYAAITPEFSWLYAKAVSLLLEAGADINIKNDKGYSAADVARDKICDPAIETEAKFICEYVFPDYAEKEVVGIVDNTASDEVL